MEQNIDNNKLVPYSNRPIDRLFKLLRGLKDTLDKMKSLFVEVGKSSMDVGQAIPSNFIDLLRREYITIRERIKGEVAREKENKIEHLIGADEREVLVNKDPEGKIQIDAREIQKAVRAYKKGKDNEDRGK